MVIYVHGSNSDVEMDVVLKLRQNSINYIISEEFNDSIEPRILLSFILLSDIDSFDQKTMKVIFQLKKNDIPVIAVYRKKSIELLDMLNKLKIFGVSIDEFDFTLHEFFEKLETWDHEYMIDLLHSENFKQLYRRKFNEILNKWILFE